MFPIPSPPTLRLGDTAGIAHAVKLRGGPGNHILGA